MYGTRVPPPNLFGGVFFLFFPRDHHQNYAFPAKITTNLMLIATAPPLVETQRRLIPWQLPKNNTAPTGAMPRNRRFRLSTPSGTIYWVPLKMMKRTHLPPPPTAISDCAAHKWRSIDRFRAHPKIGFVLPPKPILWAAGSVACHRRPSETMSNIKDARIQDNSIRSCNKSAKRFGVSQKNPGFSRGYLCPPATLAFL